MTPSHGTPPQMMRSCGAACSPDFMTSPVTAPPELPPPLSVRRSYDMREGTMHFFDVIFATRLLDDGAMYELWRQQEAGSLEYVTRAERLQNQYAQRLADDAGGDLKTLFGFNITTSIGAMLP